jgi:hypothetical protein
MMTNRTARSLQLALIWFAVWVAGGLFIAWSIDWLWFLSADSSTRNALALAVVLALGGLAGLAWYLSRARADRRWRAALDRYAGQEQAKRIYSRRNLHARSESQAR